MTQILIIGAGPTGLTLAIELLRRNVEVRIVDVANEYFKGSRGKGIQPRSLEMLDFMGIADEVMASGTLYPYIKLHLGPFGIKAWSLGTRHAATEDRPFPNLIMLEQWRTEEILRAKVASLGGKVELGAGIKALHQNEKHVTVTLTNGEAVVADYVAACDGGRSTTRGLLGLRLIGASVDEGVSVVADVEMPDLDRKFWHAYPLRRGGMHSLAPLPGGQLFQLQAPAAIAADSLERGIQRLTGKRVNRVVWQSNYRHQTRMLDQYRVGRVLIAGDAAHVHPPSGGQGLNTGLQDACNLGWKLVSAIRTGDASILDSYEAERLPVAASVLDMTKALHTSVSKSRGDRTNQLGLSYNDGRLSTGVTVGDLKPGDRVPDQRLADGSRLFETMRHGGATQLMRPDLNHVLIRPDGYVAEVTAKSVRSYHGHEVVQVEAAREKQPIPKES
ncbi:FAD-dependent monooxygenase [Comamonas sp. MYb21]|uniref:FAD-dependent monooxygenase n=1 Tax=Comamonas sp. MYb21 TaxID=1848648 RepID=UPI0030990FE3